MKDSGSFDYKEIKNVEGSWVKKICEKNHKAGGWKHIPRKRADITVFQNKIGNKLFQVTIPLDRNLGDFEEALEMDLREIESFEEEKAVH